MIKNIRHTGIVVEDLDKSLRFYMGNLGFSIAKRMVEQGDFIDQILGYKNLEVTTVKLVLDNTQMIELLDFSSHKKLKLPRVLNDIGPTHLAFSVDDIDMLYNNFMLDNIEFISAPKISPDGYAKVAFCKAPEGTYIELVEVLT